MQICFVESEVVVHQETFEARVNLDVVVIVHRVDITAAVVDGSF